MLRAFAAIITVFLASRIVSAAEPDSTIKIDAGKVLNRVTPLMYGSCIEDVNHEIYGGLYAQMIFGERFSEPPLEPVKGWRAFGGVWYIDGGICRVDADAGAKLIWNDVKLADGVVECDVRLGAVSPRGETYARNAGLVLRVQTPKLGADAFVGYELSVVSTGYLNLGRHRNNWKLLRSERAPIRPGEWQHLKVELAGRQLRAYLDGAKTPTLSYTDDEAPIDTGSIGLRTWRSDASFRSVAVESGGEKKQSDFADVDSRGQVSGLWDAVRTGKPDALLKLEHDVSNVAYLLDDAKSKFITSYFAQAAKFRKGQGTIGVANRGLNRWGLTFREGKTYSGHIILRQDGYDGMVTVALQSADGMKTYAEQAIGPVSNSWNRYDFTLKPSATDTNARFATWINKRGSIWVSRAYLSGTGDELFHDLPFRGDIGRVLQEQGLTVLRYGGSMVNAEGYRWKNMIGDRDKRPEYKGWWYPNSTNGFGIEEFLQFCEAAKFEKVFAINIEETPEDAADLVEYLNGPATSKWGAERAKNGHAAPYGVKYIEIGNEEKTAPHYIERFKLLYDAMHAKDPNVQFIIAAWWEPDNPVSKRIVQELDGKAALWDVHVGGDDLHEGRNVDALFTRMEKLVHEWAPKTPLKACVLEENGGRHDLQRALGHARVLNATQRHGDFVLIDCPANCLQPWQQNDNDWDQGQVFFTSSQVWGMPPFYAQQMAAANHLPCRVPGEAESPGNELDLTATRSEDGSTLVLKVVNIGNKQHRAAIEIAGLGAMAAQADVVTLAGQLADFNPPEAPTRIHLTKSKFDQAGERFDYEFPAYSYTILKLKRKN